MYDLAECHIGSGADATEGVVWSASFREAEADGWWTSVCSTATVIGVWLSAFDTFGSVVTEVSISDSARLSCVPLRCSSASGGGFTGRESV